MKCKKMTAVLLSLSMIVSSALTNPTSASASKKVTLSAKKLTVTVGQSKKLKLKNNKKKVTWKVTSGKKNITLKSKKKTGVTIKGKKKGTAKVQAKIGKKKYTCKITVNAKSKVKTTPKPTTQPTQTPTAPTNPTGTPTPAPTDTPEQGEVLTLYYNDNNAEEVVEQIKSSDVPVHVIVEDSVTYIEWGAFEGCSNLTSITIPESVTSISIGALKDCSNLESITVAEGNKIYDSRNDCNAIIEKEHYVYWDNNEWWGRYYPETETYIPDKNETEEYPPSDEEPYSYAPAYLIAGCKNTKIPDGNEEILIGEQAFRGCTSLTEITIPNSVTKIGLSAFFGCSGLTEITIPASVTYIDYYVFANCNSLSSITVDEGNEVYDSRGDCNAIIKKSHTALYWGDVDVTVLVAGCKNTVIPNTVEWLLEGSFEGSGLTEITIPSSVTSIGYDTFKGCSSLTSITIPDNVTGIWNNAFDGCDSLTNIVWNGNTYTSADEFLTAFENAKQN